MFENKLILSNGKYITKGKFISIDFKCLSLVTREMYQHALIYIWIKKSVKIPNRSSESLTDRGTDHIMANSKKDKQRYTKHHTEN
jgi:hypothetical protein